MEEQKQIHIKMSERLHRKLKATAALQGISMQDYVVKTIRERLQEYYSVTGDALEAARRGESES